MPDQLATDPNVPMSTLPAAAVLLAVRRLIIWALAMSWLHNALSSASHGYCPGGVSGDGGYVDADGRATDVAPQCVLLTLEPSGLVFLLVAIIVLSAITRVAHRVENEAEAIRTLDRAVVAIVVMVLAWTVITQISFAQIPVTEWDGVEPFHLPFTFGVVDVDVSPMEG